MTRTPPGPGPATGPTTSRPPRPALLVVACAVVLVQVAALVAAVVAGLVALARGAEAGPALFLVVLALGAAALLAGAVRGLWRGRRWGRGPVLTFQILVVVTAATWWGSGGGLPALVPIVLALVVAVSLLTPRVVAATSGGGRAPGA